MARRRWGRNTVIETLQERASKGLPVTTRRIREQFEPLYSAAVYYFKSWRRALKAAGIKPITLYPRLWTREQMLQIIKDVHDRAGNTLPKTLDMHARKGNSGIFNSIRHEFGSLPAARKIAGVPVKQGWTREKVLAALRKEAKNGIVQFGKVKANNPSLMKAATTYLGSWRKATEAAGVQPSWRENHSEPSTQWTKQTVLKILRLEARKGNVTINPLRSRYAGIYIAARREYGSWWNALRAARTTN